MRRIGKAGLVVVAMVAVQAASGQQVIETPPGISVFPFAGRAAGYPGLGGPQIGFIDWGNMFVSSPTEGVLRIDPTGRPSEYVERIGSWVAGLDVDGPLASRPGWTMGCYGGPSMMTLAAWNVDRQPAIFRVFPGGSWEEIMPLPATGFSWTGHLLIDRYGGLFPSYGGFMYVGTTEGIVRIDYFFATASMWAPVRVEYFTIDGSDGSTGFGRLMWASSLGGGVFAISPSGQAQPPLAAMGHPAGLAFGRGDPYFGDGLYVCMPEHGRIDVISPDGTVTPFASGLVWPTYPMFVTEGPFARNGRPTLYVLCVDDAWQFTHCPGDVNDDSAVDFADYLEFLRLYDATDARVDFTGDGQIDFGDYLAFLNYYDAGC